MRIFHSVSEHRIHKRSELNSGESTRACELGMPHSLLASLREASKMWDMAVHGGRQGPPARCEILR